MRPTAIAIAALAAVLPAKGRADSVKEAVAAGVAPSIARQVAERARARGMAPADALAPVAEAARRGLPEELVASKVLEGLAKGVPADRVLTVGRALCDRLAEADRLLASAREAGLTAPGDRRAALADLAQAAADLAQAHPGDAIRPAIAELLAAAHSARGGADAVVAAARAIGELARRGVALPDSLPLGRALARAPGLVAAQDVGAVYDAWRAEGGRDNRRFVEEAARRVEGGGRLDGMVDFFGETSDRLRPGRGEEQDARPIDSEKAKGLSPAERPDAARGAVPGLDDAVRAKRAKSRGGQ